MTLASDPIIAHMLARFDEIEERLESHRTEMYREWSQARSQRDALGRELDAFNAEMAFVLADLQQLRSSMFVLSKNSAEIKTAVDSFVAATKALVSEERQPAIETFALALGTLIAVVNGAASVQAASAVVSSHNTLEGKITQLQTDVQELQRVVGDTGDGAQ